MGQRQHGDRHYDPASQDLQAVRALDPADDSDGPEDRSGVGAGELRRARARRHLLRVAAITWCSARTTPRNTSTQPQNTCIPAQQQAANPHFTGFAATFTGNFFVGPPNELYGPFKEPKKKPMKHAIGIDPAHSQTITKPEMCGTCHTVHVPILHRGKTIGHVYEQTTYPEWAFSDYPHRRLARRRPALRLRPAGAVLPELPHAEQGRGRQSVPQQDRGDPGIHQLPAGRAHAAGGRHRPAGARRLRQAHAGRAQRLSAQDGVAVPRHPRHPQDRSDADATPASTRSRPPSSRCSIRRSTAPRSSPSATCARTTRRSARASP